MAPTKLREVRDQLGYGATEVIRMLTQLSNRRGGDGLTAASWKTKLSRWENGHEPVPKRFRALFREVYGRTNDELGFPPDAGTDETEELLSRLTLARTVDAESVRIFARQVDEARRIDRRYGGVTQLDGLRSLITQIEDLLRYAVGPHRAGLAGVLTEASALAGWEALDRNAIRSAWDHHETAKTAAREAGSPLLLAHSMAQQAFILIDLGQTDLAVEQLAQARSLAEQAAPNLLRAWLAAAHGEGLAAAGERDDALRAFDQAGALLTSDAIEPALPFLFLGGAHLDRWRGNALSELGEAEAIAQLTGALPRLPGDFNRARAGMLVNLAIAYAAAGDRESALDYSRQARRLASQIKSDRQLSRLTRVVLPG
jgi:tetratricopeptide (TPR) repeat protein